MFDQVVTHVENNTERKALRLSLENYDLDFVPNGRRLVITFEPVRNQQDYANTSRELWGAVVALQKGASVLGVRPRSADWYRGRDLHEFMRSPDFRDFSRQFETCMFYGASMGGFGALTFSRLVPGSIVLAHGPQSTLAEHIVPWEPRYKRGRDQDWTGEFVDAAEAVPLARRVYISYDPFHVLDTRHLRRLDGPNVHPIRVPFAGHVTAAFLRQIRGLRQVFELAYDGFDGSFGYLTRGRRNNTQYYTRMAERTRNKIVRQHVLERAIALSSRNARAILDLMRLHRDGGNNSAAIGYLEILLKNGNDTRRDAISCYIAGIKCYVSLNQRAAALTLLARTASMPTASFDQMSALASIARHLGADEIEVQLRRKIAKAPKATVDTDNESDEI